MSITPGFTGGTLDRADRVRHEPERLAAALADPGARLLVLDALDPVLDDAGRLTWTSLDAARGDLLFLGYEAGAPRFASALPDGEAVPMGRSPAMFSLLDRFAAPDAAHYAAARSLVFWHGRHRFCANCGAATVAAEGGHVRQCTNPACNSQHFPRTDPAVIMLVTHGDKAFLARNKRFPFPMYSTLAGFVEPGESLEETVAREVYEESGLHEIGRAHV